ncbi:MAG TPA: GH116 family glycosyl hydrolase [Acidimicrobiales bacterium]|nr:GH116 family glycosyl hydrolase [Acidimicrobiales bacterium]
MPRTSRRRVLGAVPGAALGALLAACGRAPSDEDQPVGLLDSGRLWDVPDAAWTRAIGSHPPGATGLMSAYGSLAPPTSRTKRGVPVGGIGTGSFMVNMTGSFGPWHMDIGGDDSVGSRWGTDRNSGLEHRFLSQAAFHVRYDTADGTSVQTLATEDVLPAWPRLLPERGVYSALFPRAWFEYGGLPLPTALKQVSPFVPGDERRSSLPAGLFQLAVSNPTDVAVEVSCMFSFPNAPFRLPTASYQYTRQGLRSQAVRRGNTVGVRLQAQSPANVAETERTEWVMAAAGSRGSTVTWTEDWAADGDGSDLLAAFQATGRLPNRAVDTRRLGLAGALAVSFTLAPGARGAATFCLAWDFPVVQFRNPVDGTRWWKRYTEWYGGPYRAWDIAGDVLGQAADIERAVDGWWKPIADDADYPLWLRTAALNELYYDVFGGVFWENGCLTKPKVFGRRPGQHLYFTLEADAFRDCESFDVRHYETRHLRQLFPGIERDVLLGWSDLIMADPEGRTPHDAGSPVDDPWFVVNQYAATAPGQAPLRVDWLDLPPKFVQQAHAYWRDSGDDAFAAEVYPAMVRTMEHVMRRDIDGDGIPDADGLCTTYDAIEMYGATTYVAGLVIGAFEAMADMARSAGSSSDVAGWVAAATSARTSAEERLWSEGGGYYRLDTGGPWADGLMADALCGQRYASAGGLADVLDRHRMARHLLLVYQRNVVPFGAGRLGAVNVTTAGGSAPIGLQGRAVWPGGSYFVAAVMYQIGRVLGDDDLVEAALGTGFGVYHTTYEDDASAFWFDTPALWLPGQPLRYRTAQYQRARAVWELLVAVKDPMAPSLARG